MMTYDPETGRIGGVPEAAQVAIREAVRAFGLESPAVLVRRGPGGRLNYDLAPARAAVWVVLRERPGWSYARLGALFGCEHTTPNEAINRRARGHRFRGHLGPVSWANWERAVSEIAEVVDREMAIPAGCREVAA